MVATSQGGTGRWVGWLAIWGGAILVSGTYGQDGAGRPGAGAGAGAGEAAVPSARGAVEPSAPVLPEAVVAAMQESRFDEARRAILELRDRAAGDDRSYFNYLAAVAERLGGRRAEARELLQTALREAPGGRWAAKIRFELADMELAGGNPANAEGLAQAEAARVLAPGRKDRLAEVYRTFALRRLKPDDPVVPADPEGAYALLEQAHELARGDALRAELRDAMGRASLQGGNPARAVQNFEAYLREHPEGADRYAVRFRLGEAQRGVNQALPARLTWSDLARDIERLGAARTTPELAALRASALYEIATTYGIPSPPDDASLNLGVAALRRFLAAAPGHSKSVRAAYWIAAAYLARGRASEAHDALTKFLAEDGFRVETDEAKRDWAELSMQAAFEVGRVLQGQQRYAEAIAAWKGYLARFPNGPQSADAQRAILDTQLLIAADQLERKHHAEARATWADFVARNPLDERVPGILYQIGDSFERERQFDRAIAAWETLAGKFPDSEPASHGVFQTAAILETEKGKLDAAIEKYRSIKAEPWKSQGAQRVAVMESKQLAVVTPRAFRSGDAPHLRISTRNIETLHFTAYRLDAESYFRNKQMLGGVESLDIGLVAPDATWNVPVPGYARYRPLDLTYDLKRLELPGVYAVKVTDEKTLQATTMVVGSDVEAIMKTSASQLLVLAQDMKTGRGRPGARVLVADGGQVVLEAKTGPDGVLLHTWSPARPGNQGLRFLVLDGPHVGGTALGVPGQVAQGLSPRAYIDTDRPAYRPGQKVSIRGVVREVREGQYAADAGASYRFEVADSRGRLIASKEVKLSEFGTFHETVALGSSAPLGVYRVMVTQPGKSAFLGAFQVQAYQLEPIELEFRLARTVIHRGETVEGDVEARYQYGAPMASRPIDVILPDGRTLHGMTDAAGKFHVTFPTDSFAEEQTLGLTARLPQDNVAASAQVRVAVRGFEIALRTARGVYLDGESIPLEITTVDAQGQPIGEELSAVMIRQVTVEGRVTEREVKQERVATDKKTGHGAVVFRAEDSQGGSYILRVAGTDRFGTPIVADHRLEVSGKKDPTKLRLLSDRTRFKVGEDARVNLHSRGRAGTALLTWEADRILSYRIVTLKEGDNPTSWPVDHAEFPNFTLTAARMWENELDEARLDVQVERDLRVLVKPARPVVGPGETIELDVTTVDQLGRPVSAELSLAMVDRSLLRLFNDRNPDIGAFFYNQTRTGAFSTASTNTFRYQPTTIPVPQAIVEETERAAAMMANAADRSRILEEAKRGAVAQFYGQGEPNQPGQAGLNNAFSAVAGLGAAPAPAPMEAQPNAPAKSAGRRAFEQRSYADMRDASATKDAEDEKMKEVASSVLARNRRLNQRPHPAAKLGDAESRERFVESAYWNPAVVTDKDGKARVTFRAPSALSEYRITARGITGSDTLAGQTTASLTVKKSFFVDLKAPSALTQGDRPRFIAQVHHAGARGKLALRLSTYAGGRDDVFPRELDIRGDGVDEVVFEPYEVPEGDSLRLTLTATLGEQKDELIQEVPIRPWGVPVFASSSGTSRNGTTVFVGLPAGRNYEDPELTITLAPSMRRLLVGLALGEADRPGEPSPMESMARCLPPPTNTIADRAADLLAAAAVRRYLAEANATNAPEAHRLNSLIQGLVSELVAAQNPGGGWPWVSAGDPIIARPGTNSGQPSDRMTSALVFWALVEAERIGLLTDPKVLEEAAGYLRQESTQLAAGDWDTRAALLHALSTRRGATFEAANSLNRVRNGLSDSALAYLALTFANLERSTMAGEIIGLLGPRAKSEATAPGHPPRYYWDRGGRSPFGRSATEITALVTLAYARVRPDARELERAVDWLNAHRAGGWLPRKAKGPALAALASYYGRAGDAGDRYRLTVTVNDAQVAAVDVQGQVEGRAIAVPRAAIKIGQPNRIRFELEGRGQFGYSAVLSAFTRDFAADQDRTHRTAWIERRAYYPADPELDGKTLPVGFSVAVSPTTFENTATQVGLGGRARVALTVAREVGSGPVKPEEQDFLVVQDHLPAGTTFIDGSLSTQASSYELADGVLTLYFRPGVFPMTTTYDVYGYIPGKYRTLPTTVRSADEPGRFHIGQPAEFRVRAAGEPGTDSYKPTPDELYARGKADFDAGRFARAAESLEPLFSAYNLRDDVAKDAARMLLLVSIRERRPRPIVQYFEVVREKSPELVLTFDQLMAIGSAYRDIKEYERAMIVWRGLIEASYLEDARMGELLRQRGQSLEATAYLLDLWRTYPDTPSIDGDYFGLSQVLVQMASRAFNDAEVRRELAAAGITRSQLLLQSIRMVQTFLARSPRSPMADEASLALVGAFIELEDFPSVVRLASRFARLFPKSTFLDSFQYSEALGDFHLGKYDRAIEVAGAIARATYKDAAGADQPSPNKWQAVYILGQIYDARRQPAKALDYYRQVADRFSDAADAIRSFTRKELKVAEVTVIRPAKPPAVAGGLRTVGLAPAPGDANEPPSTPSILLDYRNIARVDVKVYPVDLMQLYLTRRNLNAIAGIDLSGITPMVDRTVELGSGADFEDRKKRIDLDLRKDGAYLVLIRGENLHASGIVLVSPLELEVLEEDVQIKVGPNSVQDTPGRVRITVRDARSGDLLPKVDVKVIGSVDSRFISGQTDLRGVFVCEGASGAITAVARRGTNEYAFYRGTRFVRGNRQAGAVGASGLGGQMQPPAAAKAEEALDANLKIQNSANSLKQVERLQQRYVQPSKGKPGAAAGEFR